MPGVRRVVPIEGTGQPAGFQPLGGVAVVADNTWAAIQGRRALKVEWDLEPAGDNAGYDSAAYRDTVEATSRSPGRVIRDRGDIEAALKDAEMHLEATYSMPQLAQAPMEPPVALARVAEGRAEVWAPVQNPQAAREGVASLAGEFEGRPVRFSGPARTTFTTPISTRTRWIAWRQP